MSFSDFAATGSVQRSHGSYELVRHIGPSIHEAIYHPKGGGAHSLGVGSLPSVGLAISRHDKEISKPSAASHVSGGQFKSPQDSTHHPASQTGPKGGKFHLGPGGTKIYEK